jgi:hypothetical protein
MFVCLYVSLYCSFANSLALIVIDFALSWLFAGSAQGQVSSMLPVRTFAPLLFFSYNATTLS